jgi:hypothetical protein
VRGIILATILALITGCQRSQPDIVEKLAPHLQRFDELRNMDAGAGRDEKFARLAEDACGDGFLDVAHVAISYIEADHLRDSIASGCALILENENASLEAVRFARLIRDRDELRLAMKNIRDPRQSARR